jgi:Uma2 family endonuclease
MRMPVSKQHVEVINGVIHVMASPRFTHQAVIQRLYDHLKALVGPHDLGVVILAPADLIIRERPKLQVRQPDLMVFSNAKAGFRVADDLDRVQDSRLAPDLAVEVLSPGQSERTLQDKLADFASIGIEEVWLVDPAAKVVRVLARDGDHFAPSGTFEAGELIVSRALPGLDLRPEAVLG